MSQEYLELEVYVKHATKLAVLVELTDYDDEEVWVPFSQVEDNGEDLSEGYRGRIYVTEWFCEKEGLA